MGRRQPNKDSTDQNDILLATNRQNDDILYCLQWNKMNKVIFEMNYLHFQMLTIMKLSYLLIVYISFHFSMDFVSVNNLKIEVLFKSSMPGQENDIRSILLK